MKSIKALRDDTGKSRSLVAADLNMSERHLYRLETGKSPLRRILALGFADYYGVPVDDIAGQPTDEPVAA